MRSRVAIYVTAHFVATNGFARLVECQQQHNSGHLSVLTDLETWTTSSYLWMVSRSFDIFTKVLRTQEKAYCMLYCNILHKRFFQWEDI